MTAGEETPKQFPALSATLSHAANGVKLRQQILGYERANIDHSACESSTTSPVVATQMFRRGSYPPLQENGIMKRFTSIVLALAAGGTLALLSFDTQPAMAYDGGSCPTAITKCGTFTSPVPVCIEGVCEYIEIDLLGLPSQT